MANTLQMIGSTKMIRIENDIYTFLVTRSYTDIVVALQLLGKQRFFDHGNDPHDEISIGTTNSNFNQHTAAVVS